MTEQEFQRRSFELSTPVDFAHARWMAHPANLHHLERYERALADYVRKRVALVDRYYTGSPRRSDA